MKSSVQKVKKQTNQNENITTENGHKDFVSLSKEIGYIRARQLLKQVSVQRHQDKINNVDEKKMNEYRPARLKAAVHLSMTYGSPDMETDIVNYIILFYNYFSYFLFLICYLLFVYFIGKNDEECK